MKIIFVMVLAISAYGNTLINELKNLSPQQAEVMKMTWEKGKALDLHYTLTAIAWQESSFGKYKIGKWSPDYGTFQINLKTYKSRYAKEIKAHNLSDKKIRSYLIDYYDLGFVAATDEILFWKRVHRGNWNKIWASYNDGTHISSKGRSYSKQIAAKIKALKAFTIANN